MDFNYVCYLDSFVNEYFARIQLNGNYKANPERIDYLLRSASHALATLQNLKMQHVVTVANAYETVLSEIAQDDAYDNDFVILNWSLFEQFVKFVPKMPPSAFNLSVWLRNNLPPNVAATNVFVGFEQSAGFQIHNDNEAVTSILSIKKTKRGRGKKTDKPKTKKNPKN